MWDEILLNLFFLNEFNENGKFLKSQFKKTTFISFITVFIYFTRILMFPKFSNNDEYFYFFRMRSIFGMKVNKKALLLKSIVKILMLDGILK